MINKLLIILGAFCLTGCMGSGEHINPIQTKYEVVMPENTYFQGCDIVKLPDPKTLTNTEIAQLIADLVKTNRICHNNNQAIHDFLVAAQQQLDKNNPKN